MNSYPPQFRVHIAVTFEEHGPDRRRQFGFDESGHRRLPMSMDGVEGLHTVGLWIKEKGAVFLEGDEFDADCRVIWPEGFRDVVAPGVKLKLWDAGFFARGEVIERCESGWEVPV